MTNVADLGGPPPGPTGHVLGHAVGAEDTTTVATVVLAAPVRWRRESNLAVLTVGEVIFVLPADLRIGLMSICPFISYRDTAHLFLRLPYLF